MTSANGDVLPEPGYDPQSGTFHAYHDAEEEDLCISVVTAVAAIKGIDPRELSTPLNDRIDPDALDMLFSPAADDAARADEYLRFSVDGFGVRVHSDGHIVIRPPGRL